MKYLVPFPCVMRWAAKYVSPDADQYDLPYTHYVAMIRRFLEPVAVDEAWYRAAYPGIAGAIERGIFRSAYHHFLAHGYFENRSPYAPGRAGLRPPVPFADILAVTRVHPTRDGLHVRMSSGELTSLVELLLQPVPVDGAWYSRTYAGVEAALDSGEIASAASHFSKHGYRECRWPFAMAVDESWYLGRYRDVANAVAAGKVASGQDHFWRVGYGEGRFPTRAPPAVPAGGHAAAA
jgi:hypothetical protein